MGGSISKVGNASGQRESGLGTTSHVVLLRISSSKSGAMVLNQSLRRLTDVYPVFIFGHLTLRDRVTRSE